MGMEAIKPPTTTVLQAALAETGPLGQVASVALSYLIDYGTNATLNYLTGTPKATVVVDPHKENIAQIAGTALGTLTGTGVGIVGMGIAAVGLTAVTVGVGPAAPIVLATGAAVGLLASPAAKVAQAVVVRVARRAL